MQTCHHVRQQPSTMCAEAKLCMHRPGLPVWCTRTQPGSLARQRPQARLGQSLMPAYVRGPASDAGTAFPSLQDRRQNSCTVSTGFKHQVRCAAAAEQVSGLQTGSSPTTICSRSLCHSRPALCLQAEVVQHVPADSSFEAMAAGTKRKYIMISGKGGVGKTSLAASLAVKFAAAGHTTLVVSTDPAHSLSDSLDQVLRQSCSQSKRLAACVRACNDSLCPFFCALPSWCCVAHTTLLESLFCMLITLHHRT